MRKVFLKTETSGSRTWLMCTGPIASEDAQRLFDTALSEFSKIQSPKKKVTSLYQSALVYDFTNYVQSVCYLIEYDERFPWGVFGPDFVEASDRRGNANSLLFKKILLTDGRRSRTGCFYLDDYHQAYGLLDLRKPVSKTVRY